MSDKRQLLLDRILSELGDDESAALLAVLHSDAANTHIAETLTAHGYAVGEKAVRSWRKAQRDHPPQ